MSSNSRTDSNGHVTKYVSEEFIENIKKEMRIKDSEYMEQHPEVLPKVYLYLIIY